MTVPNLKFNTNWLPVPWAEYIGKDGSQGAHWNAGWEQGGTQSTFTVLINWEDAPQFEAACLGYSVFNPATGNLQRTLPARHPFWSDQFAERIVSAVPVRWDSKINQFIPIAFQSISTGAPLSEYDFFLVTIGFAKPKYRVLSDADLYRLYGGSFQEWRRFVEVNVEPHIQMFSREGNDWKWLDNGAGGAGTPTVGQVLTAPLNVGIYGAEWHVKWRRLPRRGLMAGGGVDESFNSNIISCYNKVHNGATNLWDMPGNVNTGALRFVSAKATALASPFDPIIQGLSYTDYNTYYDVDMVFSEWRPPAGNATNQGWNLAPNPGDNKWYLVGTATTSDTLFQTTDLTTVFKLSLT